MSVRSITPNDPANFTPTLGDYKDLQPFRYWCQKVLPLVYDDSLSYYELLCKTVDYLNKTMEDVDVLEGDVTNLHEAYVKLQDYVNKYFDSLDVQEEINNKLDEMVTTGVLSKLINTYFIGINNELSKINTRIDNFTRLNDGSTTADAEIIDGRITWSGYTETNLGSAIRAQVQNNAGSILEIAKNMKMKRLESKIIKGKSISNTGEIIDTETNNIISEYIDISSFKYIKIKCSSFGNNAYCSLYDKNKKLLFYKNGYGEGAYKYYNDIIPVFNGIKYIVISSHTDSYDTKIECAGYTFNNNIDIFKYFEKEHIKIFKNFSVSFNPGYVILLSTGELISTTAKDYYVSNPINLPIELNEIYVTANNKFGNATIAFYSSNNIYIKGLSNNLIEEKIEIPPLASYCRIAWSGSDYNNASVKELVSYEDKPYNKEWSGKQWCCIGDSLTEENSRTSKHYYDYVKEKTDIKVTINAVSGTGYAKGGEDNFEARCKNIGIYDVYTIFGSFNDLSSNYPIGDINDYNDTTICGFINNTISNIYISNPLAVVGIVSPTPWIYAKPGTPSSDNYVEALKNICYNRGIPFLDLYHDSGLRPWEEKYRELVYSKDDGNGVHPNEIGHKLIAPKFYEFLLSLVEL